MIISVCNRPNQQEATNSFTIIHNSKRCNMYNALNQHYYDFIIIILEVSNNSQENIQKNNYLHNNIIHRYSIL